MIRHHMIAESDTDGENEEGLVCSSCLFVNSPDATHCHECSVPIDGVDALQRIRSVGFTPRSTVESPPKLVILIGVWMIFAPAVLLTPFLLYFEKVQGFVATVWSSCVMVGSVCILYYATKHHVDRSRGSNEPNS